MAEKQSYIVHPDGSRSDGMFRWGGKPKIVEYDPAILQAGQDAEENSAAERVAKLRERLTQNVAAHLQGPGTAAEVVNPDPPGSQQYIQLATGGGYYIISPNAPPALGNALDALDVIRGLEHALAHGGDTDLIVKFALDLGVLIERFRLRTLFAPTVMSAAKLQLGRSIGGANSAKLSLTERAKVIKERDRRAKKERRPKSAVARVIRTELLRGTFPGIDRKVSNPPGVDRIRTMR